jgi:hypothetical protein
VNTGIWWRGAINEENMNFRFCSKRIKFCFSLSWW